MISIILVVLVFALGLSAALVVMSRANDKLVAVVEEESLFDSSSVSEPEIYPPFCQFRQKVLCPTRSGRVQVARVLGRDGFGGVYLRRATHRNVFLRPASQLRPRMTLTR